MAAAVNVLGEIAPGRKIAVIGDMLELGEASRQAHERVGKQLADVGVAILLTVGEMAGYAAAAAQLHGVADVVACRDHQQAVGELQKRLLPGDTLLVKGSRGMQMEKVLTVFAPASEE
jgi:UDP-N-acetylmuramyl pentapeptide synthase